MPSAAARTLGARARTSRPGRASRATRLGRALRWIALATVVGATLDALYLAWIWPDWKALASGPAPRSRFIEAYEESRASGEEPLPPLRFTPVPYAQIADSMKRTVVVAEDARFWAHEGVDYEALKEAVDRNLEEGRIVFGGSTISQQTAKNLFLSPARTPLRKWHELLLTYAMERHLPKRRILELYLNVAQFGRGVFGVEAAARHYWGTSAASLSWHQAAELAAALPSPVADNPATRTARFQRRVQKIERFVAATR
ncbi:MAG TPA: monofunctional biosynthetic peptidoglycan transglycosylase [Myxococcota bacterium]|jgi:monofunctional biosynthetic peptidoglycan transglycosylase|nr:monofunctional biosynthetic peptidoglycan transglycosylase [Myxococcota bacterium]